MLVPGGHRAEALLNIQIGFSCEISYMLVEFYEISCVSKYIVYLVRFSPEHKTRVSPRNGPFFLAKIIVIFRENVVTF